MAGKGRGEAPRRAASTRQLAWVQETRWLQGLQTAVTAQSLHSTQEFVEVHSVNTQPLRPLRHLVLGSATGEAAGGQRGFWWLGAVGG